MDGLAPQLSYHFGNVILLKKPDRRNPSRARVNTGVSVLELNAAQSNNLDFLPASFTQPIQTGQVGLWGIFLFEDGGEHREIRSFQSCASNLVR